MKTPPKVPSEPKTMGSTLLGTAVHGPLLTANERKQGMRTNIFLGFVLSLICAVLFRWWGEMAVEIDYCFTAHCEDEAQPLWLGLLIFSVGMTIYYFFAYITTESSDEKSPAAIKYEQDMKQYQLEKETYEEELKKDSPFYIGDGTTGSEMKNTCKRCNKIWYLDAEELQFLEEKLQTSKKLIGQTSGISLVGALFNPMLAAQMQTGNMALARPLQRLQEELNEKSRCPECNSRSIERTLVGEDEKPVHKKTIIKRKKSSPSKMQELEKLSEMKKEGLIDADEFQQMKKEILGK